MHHLYWFLLYVLALAGAVALLVGLWSMWTDIIDNSTAKPGVWRAMIKWTGGVIFFLLIFGIILVEFHR